MSVSSSQCSRGSLQDPSSGIGIGFAAANFAKKLHEPALAAAMNSLQLAEADTSGQSSPPLTEKVTPRVFGVAPMAPFTPEQQEIYTKRFSDEEKRVIKDCFFQLYPDVDSVEFIEKNLEFRGRKTKRKIVCIATALIGEGGNANVRFGATRGKKDPIKLMAFLEAKKIHPQNPIEKELSDLPRGERMIQKVWATNEPELRVQHLAVKGDLWKCTRKSRSALKTPYAKQMIQRYADLFKKGFVHGDIKIENFLVHKDDTVFLSDVDTARPYSAEPGTLAQGTKRFWPKDSENINRFHADIYALGCAILELCYPPALFHIDRTVYPCTSTPVINDQVPLHLESNWEALEAKLPTKLRKFVMDCLFRYKEMTIADLDAILAQLA